MCNFYGFVSKNIDCAVSFNEWFEVEGYYPHVLHFGSVLSCFGSTTSCPEDMMV